MAVTTQEGHNYLKGDGPDRPAQGHGGRRARRHRHLGGLRRVVDRRRPPARLLRSLRVTTTK